MFTIVYVVVINLKWVLYKLYLILNLEKKLNYRNIAKFSTCKIYRLRLCVEIWHISKII